MYDVIYYYNLFRMKSVPVVTSFFDDVRMVSIDFCRSQGQSLEKPLYTYLLTRQSPFINLI